jgi:hypothetical protein
MSANISMGRTMPVEARAGNTLAINETAKIPKPGIPVLVRPIMSAHIETINHSSPFKSYISSPVPFAFHIFLEILSSNSFDTNRHQANSLAS